MNVFYLRMKLSQLLTMVGFYVLVAALVGAYYWEPNQSFFWCSILYCLVILNRRTQIKEIECEQSLFDSQIPEIIDSIISECLNEYIAMNTGFNDDQEYIREEEENKINTILIEKVLTRMSKTMIAKIRSYYNEERVEDVLVEKIYMLVTHYVIQNNRIEQDSNLELESARKNKEPKLVDVL